MNSAYRDFVCNDIPAHTITEPRTICPRSIKHGPLKRPPSYSYTQGSIQLIAAN